MRIALTGDVMLGRLVDAAMRKKPPEYFWGDTLPLIRSADLSLINLECALTRSEEKWTRTLKVFHFRADPARAIRVLEAARISFVNLANNHVLDFEIAGLKDTLAALRRAGIGFCGAGMSLAQAAEVQFAEAAGKTIAIFGATDNTPEWEADEQPGVQYIEFHKRSTDKLSESVKQAAEKADIVIASLHWGPNMRQRPTGDFRDFAHGLIRSGVDIIHGHSAHIFQEIEIYKGGVILYDTGDYIDDYAVGPLLRNDQSFLFILDIGPTITKIELCPTVVDTFQVNLAKGDEHEEICSRMQELSAEMGTKFERSDSGLFAEVASRRAADPAP